MDIEAALAWVTEFIQQHDSTPAGFTASLVTWNLPDASLRVAEVSWISADKRSGASFMQSDLPYGLAVCAQAERCVITAAYMDDEDETQLELDRLAFLLASER